MQSDTKIKVLSVVAAVFLVIIAGMGYYSWKMSQELKERHENVAIGLQPQDPLLAIPELPDMAIDPWSINNDAMEQFKQIDKQMDDMMHSMSSQQSFFNHHSFGLSSSNPKVQMSETDKEYRVVIDVPEGQNIEITTGVKDNMFSISGLIKSENKKSTSNGSEHQTSVSRFSQSVYLAHPINEKGILTKQERSRTTITIPKT